MNLDELTKQGPSRRRVDKVLEAYNALSDDKKEQFRAIVTNLDYSASEVASALSGEGSEEINAAQIVYFRSKLREGKVTL